MLQSPWQLPNFCWLWVGQMFIYCAGQFWFVALTWLVLQKTGSGIALGMEERLSTQVVMTENQRAITVLRA